MNKTQDDRYQNFSIEIDSPPFSARPDDLIGGVLKGTGLTLKDFENSGAPFFGHKTWILKDGSPKRFEKFTKAKPVFKERLTALYNEGFVRYATW